MRLLYIYNGDSYTGKMSSWNWDWSQVMPWCIRCLIGGCHQHDEVIKWKHFPCYWPFVQGFHWSLVNSPSQTPVMRSFDVSFDLCLKKWLSKQSRGWWFETSSRPLWRQCNVKNFRIQFLSWITPCPAEMNVFMWFQRRKTWKHHQLNGPWLYIAKIDVPTSQLLAGHHKNLQDNIDSHTGHFISMS